MNDNRHVREQIAVLLEGAVVAGEIDRLDAEHFADEILALPGVAARCTLWDTTARALDEHRYMLGPHPDADQGIGHYVFVPDESVAALRSIGDNP